VPWPAWYKSADPCEGTAYILPHDFTRVFARHRHAGQAWRYGKAYKQWTTYCPSRRVSYKNLTRLGIRQENAHDPTVEKDFWNIMHEAERQGLTPPTSLADMFMSVCRVRMPALSCLAPFRGYGFGGWEQAVKPGPHTKGTVYQYDLNRAYRWAATASPLPDTRTATHNDNWDAGVAVYLIDAPAGVIPWARSPGVQMISSEMRDALGLRAGTHRYNVRFLYGVEFRETTELGPTFATIDERFPYCAKRIGQTFWGMWNTESAPEQCSWPDGNEQTRMLKNPFYNPVWSLFVTSRVKLRMNLHIKKALRIYVDSVHTTEPLPTGTEPGEWKLVDEYADFWLKTARDYGNGDIQLTGLRSQQPIEPRYYSRAPHSWMDMGSAVHGL
jgi:hypothetical protein